MRLKLNGEFGMRIYFFVWWRRRLNRLYLRAKTQIGICAHVLYYTITRWELGRKGRRKEKSQSLPYTYGHQHIHHGMLLIMISHSVTNLEN